MENPQIPRHEKTILVLEPNAADRDRIAYRLQESGYNVLSSGDGTYGLNVLDTGQVDVVITALVMKPVSGTRVLEVARAKDRRIGVIFITDYGDVESAVRCMRAGAFDFLQKPVNIDKLIAIVDKVVENQAVEMENLQLHRQLDSKYGLSNIIGNSSKMVQIFEKIAQVADSKATVLITGESGTGKELVAHAIHYNSPRRDQPFIRLNCGALAEGVVESELFGHEKGAFTGAVTRRQGRFELADAGTLFLDEVGEISPAVQVKLLRVLETGEFERVGGMRTVSSDVRLITATNRDLWGEVQKGRYREDLFYRLNVVHLELPPLRERIEDLPLLVDHFIHEFAAQHQKEVEGVTNDVMTCFYQYHWPGNIRELRNCIEGMVVLSRGSLLQLEDVPYHVRQGARRQETAGYPFPLDTNRQLQDASTMILRGLHEYMSAYLQSYLGQFLPSAPQLEQNDNQVTVEVGHSLEDMEKKLIEATLKKVDYNKSQAAKVLGIGRKTLYKKLEEYGIDGEPRV